MQRKNVIVPQNNIYPFFNRSRPSPPQSFVPVLNGYGELKNPLSIFNPAALFLSTRRLGVLKYKGHFLLRPLKNMMTMRRLLSLPVRRLDGGHNNGVDV